MSSFYVRSHTSPFSTTPLVTSTYKFEQVLTLRLLSRNGCCMQYRKVQSASVGKSARTSAKKLRKNSREPYVL